MDLPSGPEIAAWFNANHAQRLGSFQGCDGLDLMREGADYCYVWLEAYVDFDLTGYFLLDVRTSVGEIWETRDFLFVSSRGACEWHQYPVAFRDPAEVHRQRFVAGMTWFAQRIELDIDSEGAL